MFVAGEIFNFFILTGISNINIFFIKNKSNFVVTSNICDKFASKILTYNVKKNYTNKFIKNKHHRFLFERVEDVCPLPGPGQSRPLPLILPQHVRLRMISSIVVLALW